MSTRAGGTDHLFLFTYVNSFFLDMGFRFNIKWLFVYLFKAMSTKTGGSDHLFLFTYVTSFFLDLVFVVIFSIYLFIYSKRCQQNQVEVTTFIYLWKLLVVRHAFCFNIHDLFVYLLELTSVETGGTDDLYFNIQ